MPSAGSSPWGSSRQPRRPPGEDGDVGELVVSGSNGGQVRGSNGIAAQGSNEDATGGARDVQPHAGAPPLGAILRRRIEEALTAAETLAAGRPVVALDAGCGERTAFRSVRGRIGRLVGVDVHPPSGSGLDVDAFVLADLCAGPPPVPEASVDLAASIFTLEHFPDPGAALRNLGRCLVPGGRLVIVTVNRRHPFVAAYFALPDPIRRRLQRLLKARAAEAHPLVGACNTPGAIREALVAAGFSVEAIDTIGHLATAWGRRPLTRLLGRIGDRLTAPFPGRRSTLVVLARRREPGQGEGPTSTETAELHPVDHGGGT